MVEVIPYLIELQDDKGKLYGRSYARHGDISIFMNVERKFDRLANMMESAMKNGTDKLYEMGTETETFLDTVADLAIYSTMWVGYIKENHPEVWESFVSRNNLGKENGGKPPEWWNFLP